MRQRAHEIFELEAGRLFVAAGPELGALAPLISLGLAGLGLNLRRKR